MKVPEQFRVTTGPMASEKSFGNNGYFKIYHEGYDLFVIASDGEGWEHVSVSLNQMNRTPTWKQMCFIKELFWGEDEWVVQFHPARDEYIDNHPGCLHLWRPNDGKFPTPESALV